MKHEEFMKIALAEAKKGDTPFGAVIVKDNRVIIQGHNTTQIDKDVSAHAETKILRSLTKKLQKYSLDVLEGYTLYTTCEPCPMCAAACVWAGISEIVYGASIKDLISLDKPQIDISCDEIIAKGFSEINIVKGILRDKCLALFK
ncbi:nucleoside deaminase [Oscillatoria salina]|uniref:nucleoside deaminase n=1 Tax=Oscillatoria salina TaxID=331517 RepID=UPI001CCAF0C3|nr:nucleoside deaminase [Oscillatoria salina]MBZ8180670.1 nucleoside deaminase [Oscillatoria salina IIICB1]